MTAFVTVVAGVYGLVIGSFLNVVIWRVPRHESIVKPRSHCPSCDTQLATRDNIPLVSWLVLRGRCRHCGTDISIRYPLVELLTGLLFAAVGARFSHSWALPAFLVLTGALIAISAIDLEHFIIPNRIVYPVGFASVFLLALAALIDNQWAAFGRSLLGALAAFTFFFVLHLVAPGGMGFGDVRLSFVLGLFLGWLGLARGARRSLRGLPLRRGHRHPVDRVRRSGPAPAHPVRAVPGRGHDDLRARRRPARQLVARLRHLIAGGFLGKVSPTLQPDAGLTIVARATCPQTKVTPWTGSSASSRYEKSPTP